MEEPLLFATPAMTLVLIEPQACFAAAFARLFELHAPEVAIRAAGSLGEGAVAGADVVLLDIDPDLMDPVSAAEEVSRRGGRATIAVSAREFHLSEREAPHSLLGIVPKGLPPRGFVDTVIRAARGETRTGILPNDWRERRMTGGALPFVGCDRRGRLAAG